MNAHAKTAVAQAISAAIDDVASDGAFERRVLIMFGMARGSELLKSNYAVRDAAEAVIELCVDRLARNHWAYDLSEHMGAKALYDEACARIRASENMFRIQAAE
jgi:hypothetical protein